MDRPQTMSMKEWLVRNMSTSSMISEKVIMAVVNHQFEGALKAVETCDSVEFSGWGKFVFKRKRAHYVLLSLESIKLKLEEKLLEDISPKVRASTERKLNELNVNIEILKERGV